MRWKPLAGLAIFLFVFTMGVNTAQAKFISIDVQGHFTRQLTDPAINILGGGTAVEIKLMKLLGIEVYGEFDYYKIKYTNATYTFKNINFGGGLRIHLLPWIYVRGVFGRLHSMYDTGSSTGSTGEWRYGGGLGVQLPMAPFIAFHFGANFYRIHGGLHGSSGENQASAQAGLTFHL